jgi:ActR/RegA family two-component response regulator
MNVLILDDEKEKRSDLTKHLKIRKYDVYPVSDIETAIKHIRAQTFDFAIIDLKIDYSDEYGGIKVIKYLNEASPKTKIIVLSAYEIEKDTEVEKRLKSVFYDGYVSKGGEKNYINAVIDELEVLKVTPQKKKCFVIMPFASTESCSESQWLDIFENTIKPAVDESGFDYTCFRASLVIGNIIKDILDNLYNADVVIADLTDRNANVFYELGIRHALKDATILISQDMKHIPFDTKDYVTLIYDWKTKQGRDEFKKNIKKILSVIEEGANEDKVESPIKNYLKIPKNSKRTFRKPRT